MKGDVFLVSVHLIWGMLWIYYVVVIFVSVFSKTYFLLVGMDGVKLHLLQFYSSFQVHLVTLHQEYKNHIEIINIS